MEEERREGTTMRGLKQGNKERAGRKQGKEKRQLTKIKPEGQEKRGEKQGKDSRK